MSGCSHQTSSPSSPTYNRAKHHWIVFVKSLLYIHIKWTGHMVIHKSLIWAMFEREGENGEAMQLPPSSSIAVESVPVSSKMQPSSSSKF